MTRKTMLTLLGILLIFLSSAFPDFLKLWRDHSDRKHELAILDRQMEAQRQGHTQRLEYGSKNLKVIGTLEKD